MLVLATSFARHLPTASGYELAGWLTAPTLEFIAIHSSSLGYKPSRVWLFGTMMGVGAGRLFHRYLQDPTDPTSWIVMIACAVPAAIAALYYHLILKNPKGE